MRILGLDISYTRTGVALVEEVDEPGSDLFTSYHLHSTWTLSFPPSVVRLYRAYRRIYPFIHETVAPLNPDLSIIEDPAYSAPNPVVTGKLIELATLFKICLEAHNMPYLTASPSTVKKHITGRGDGTKLLVAQQILRQHGIDLVSDVKVTNSGKCEGGDLSDATALALWGFTKRSHGK